MYSLVNTHFFIFVRSISKKRGKEMKTYGEERPIFKSGSGVIFRPFGDQKRFGTLGRREADLNIATFSGLQSYRSLYMFNKVDIIAGFDSNHRGLTRFSWNKNAPSFFHRNRTLALLGNGSPFFGQLHHAGRVHDSVAEGVRIVSADGIGRPIICA